ncbi:MAG TPA: transcriptional regulator NrdR [Clostridiales bacterium]|nr:transcriptional regulator NrdR [Clostridiales bacterium]
MKCPYCGTTDHKVIDSRPAEEGLAIRRRRECPSCGGRFTTYEKIEKIPLMVIKKDNSREPFDRDKLLKGLLKACEKRPVDVEALAIEIENTLSNSLKAEVNSAEVGDMVMERLKKLDEIAYVRFASVYRQFKDVDSFMQELEKFKKEK